MTADPPDLQNTTGLDMDNLAIQDTQGVLRHGITNIGFTDNEGVLARLIMRLQSS